MQIHGGSSTIERIRIERVDAAGRSICCGADVTASSLVIADTGGADRHVLWGSGIQIGADSRLTLDAARVSRAHGAAVAVLGVEPSAPTIATLTDVVLEDTAVSLVAPFDAHGLVVSGNASATIERARTRVDGSGLVVRETPEAGAVGVADVTLRDVMMVGGGASVSEGCSIDGAGVAIAETDGAALSARGDGSSITLSGVVLTGVGAAAVDADEDASVELDTASWSLCDGPAIEASGGAAVTVVDATLEATGPVLAERGSRVALSRARFTALPAELLVAADAPTSVVLTDVRADSETWAPSIAALVRRGAAAELTRVALALGRADLVVAAEAGSSLRMSDLTLACVDVPAESECVPLYVVGSASAEADRVVIAGARGLGAGARDAASTLTMRDLRLEGTDRSRCCGTALGVLASAVASVERFVISDAPEAGVSVDGAGSASLRAGRIARAPIGVAAPPGAADVTGVAFEECAAPRSDSTPPVPAAPVLP